MTVHFNAVRPEPDQQQPNIMLPCTTCCFGASFAIELHRSDTRETMWGMTFCRRCANLLNQLLRPLQNPKVLHFMQTRLDACDPAEVN